MCPRGSGELTGSQSKHDNPVSLRQRQACRRNLSLCLGESLRDRGWQRQQMGENNGEGRQQGGGRREEKVGNKKQNEKNQLRAEGSVNVRGGSK